MKLIGASEKLKLILRRGETLSLEEFARLSDSLLKRLKVS